MPIEALPPSTVSAIGSTQALTDSASLIKELVDNAIDARATTISVEISVNTLDDLRVKDNGYGITPEDRLIMCTRYCTSKIRDLTDLRNIGGRSLGFRGEALASAAEMSGCLTVSTRIEGEPTAAEIVFNRQGQISSEKRISLPVGTTVRVEKFLKTLPVRKQTALKTTVKVVTKIKRTLQAYALARPYLRLSLKILKAKNDKDNWKYPKTGQTGISKVAASPLNAAAEIIGKRIIDQCQWTTSTWSSAGEENSGVSEDLNHSANQAEAYTFEAVIARPDCDGSIVSNVGQFISVDSRPVSSRGTFKQIVSLYKGGVRLANDVGAKVVDPILCMNMVCPRGSYDANVEPAKDDVLFVNPDLVLRLAGKFFKSVYGERQLDMPKAKPSSTPGTHGIELMLAMRRTPVENDSPIPRVPVPSTPPAMSHDLDFKDSHRQNMRLSYEPTNAVMVTSGTYMQGKELISGSTMVSTPSSSILPEASSELSEETLLPAEPSTNLTWKPSMYAEDDDDMEELDQFLAQSAQPAVDNGAEEDTALRSVHVSNPWVMAKLNAPFRPPLSVQQRDSHKDMNHQLPTPGRQVGDVGARTDHSTDDFIHDLTTPASDVAKPRQSGREFLNDPVHASPDPFPFPQKARASRHTAETPTGPNESNRERREHGALDTWVQRSLNSSVEPFGQDAATLEAVVEPAGFQHRGDFVSARSLPHGTALSDIPDASQKPRRRPAQRKQQQGTINKPFVSPVNDPEHVWFDAFDKPNRKYPQHTPRRREPKNTAGAAAKLILRDDEIEAVQLNMATTSQCSMHPDLAITMEYEARKQRAEHQRRELLRQKALAERRDARIVNDEPGSAAEAPNAKISPHKNRQYKAIAALHNADDPSVDAPFLRKTHAFQADDPRAYLVWEQQREAAQLQNGPNALRPKRRKNIMLPFETMPENNHIRELILPLTISRLEIENMVEKSTLHDEYIREGEDAEAFSSPTNREIGTWEEKLKLLIKASYRIEGMAAEEEMDGDLEVDLVAVLQKHAAEIARLETEEQALLEEQASQAYAAETIDLTGS